MLLILAYLGGILTILSPCILPVLPFVFMRADRPFRTNGLPLLAGMAVTFALVATLVAFGGGWAVRVNEYGRLVAMIVLLVLGAALLSRRLAEWLMRPLVALGRRLSTRLGSDESIGHSLGLGIATGLLWTPCAGPILGLILAGAALQGPSAETTLLLLAYAAGAATSLTAALLLGGRAMDWMKRSLGVGEWLRRGLGALVIVAVATIAMGVDSGLLARVSLASTGGLEQQLLAAVKPATAADAADAHEAEDASGNADLAAPYPVRRRMPELAGATHWLNSEPLTRDDLRGKVVLVDFWTYSCINCIRTFPYITAWNRKYADHGLVIIGVHTPEFAFEKNAANVERAVDHFGIQYPVAMDNDYQVWRAFHNRYWPAHYFVDALGRIRQHHFGEGGYEEAEDIIRALLTEAGYTDLPGGYVDPDASGAQAAAPINRRSPETYLGYARARNFSGDPLRVDKTHDYQAPQALAVNHWSLDGRWHTHAEHSELVSDEGNIVYRFRGRDLHLVMGPGDDGEPVHFRVTIDGHAPGENHGADIDADGHGMVDSQRLYQLVRLRENGEHTVTITFEEPGVRAYAFTFG